MGSPGRSFKGFIALLCFVWCFLVGKATTAAATPTTMFRSRPAGNLKRMTETGYKKVDVRKMTDLNYVSKRRVPNGPDPIHNRRAGNSRRSPGNRV